MTTSIDEEVEQSEPIVRLSKDLLAAAATLSEREVRYIVDSYYQIQEVRKSTSNQILATTTAGEPAQLLTWFKGQSETIEGQIRNAMKAWVQSRRVGRWMMDQKGIGPVLAAGLMARIDIAKAPTAGNIWRYAGYDPTYKWLGREQAALVLGMSASPLAVEAMEEEALADESALTPDELALLDEVLLSQNKPQLSTAQITRIAVLTKRKFTNLLNSARNKQGQVTRDSMLMALARRPWDANLKTLCWKVGDSFVKVSGKPDAIYGMAYRERKIIEITNNEAGRFADQAEEAMKRKLSPNQKEYYEKGLLPPARIDLRARRWAVKLFLSHLQHVMYEDRYGVAPRRPYVIEHVPGHSDYIAPPGWPRD